MTCSLICEKFWVQIAPVFPMLILFSVQAHKAACFKKWFSKWRTCLVMFNVWQYQLPNGGVLILPGLLGAWECTDAPPVKTCVLCHRKRNKWKGKSWIPTIPKPCAVNSCQAHHSAGQGSECRHAEGEFQPWTRLTQLGTGHGGQRLRRIKPLPLTAEQFKPWGKICHPKSIIHYHPLSNIIHYLSSSIISHYLPTSMIQHHPLSINNHYPSTTIIIHYPSTSVIIDYPTSSSMSSSIVHHNPLFIIIHYLSTSIIQHHPLSVLIHYWLLSITISLEQRRCDSGVRRGRPAGCPERQRRRLDAQLLPQRLQALLPAALVEDAQNAARPSPASQRPRAQGRDQRLQPSTREA